MASSSSSSQSNYDVFISFRGEDTRSNFTSHLAAALSRRHVSTFIDDKLPRGQEISTELLQTIEGSKVSVIIFSENYADSRWCLDELVKVMECNKIKNQEVLPIFYHIDPSDVGKQIGNFGEAFKTVKEKFKSNSDKVQKWTVALTEASDLSGWTCSKFSTDSELCEEVASYIKRLCPTSFTAPPDLFGVNSVAKKIKSNLRIGKPDVRCIGIWGIGGIGKTTIAELVFSEILDKFDLHCFFPDVTKQYDKSHSIDVRKNFYSDLGFNSSNIWGSHMPSEILEDLKRKKVLVVLDNVSKSDQLDDLGLSKGCFGQGSRVIITSRDKQVFNSCADGIHLMEGLRRMDAVQLFRMKAFSKMNPTEGHMLLVDRVVDYCKGVPLALKVLGSHLSQRNSEQWEIQLSNLEQNYPEADVMDVLKISYDSLSSTEKDIFLIVACCFQGYKKDKVIHILDACGFPSSEHGLMRLEDKCLITIGHDIEGNIFLEMHDLIEEMGRHIAQEQEQGSRLFNSQKICSLLRNDRGNDAVEVICLNMKGMQKVKLHPEVFLRLHNLKILIFHDRYRKGQNVEFIVESDQSDHIPCLPTMIKKQTISCLPRNLIVLHWATYPFKSLPSKLCTENLVELVITDSNIIQLWQGNQCLENLKTLDLSHCRQLIRLPNLSSATNLISINLTDCYGLDEIDPCIQNLKNLAHLNLSGCNKLQRLSSMVELESLETLSLDRCSSLKILPDIPTDIKRLILDNSGVEEWPLSTYYLRKLSFLSMQYCTNITKFLSELVLSEDYVFLDALGCTNLQNLPKIKGNVRQIHLTGSQVQELPLLDGLSSLQYVTLSQCSKLTRLPSLHDLRSLKMLHLDTTDIVEIPNDIALLSSLDRLWLINCNRLEYLPKLPENLEELKAINCACLKKVESTSYSPVRYFYTFCYLNCVNLDKQERSKMMLDAHHFIKKLAIAHKTCHFGNYLFAIPGSEIPEWVMYQSQETSLAIAFPQNFFNTDNLLGFAFYIVIDFPFKCVRLLKVSVRHNNKSVPYLHGHSYSCYSCSTLFQSDNVFVLYKEKHDFVRIIGRRAFEFIPEAFVVSGEKIKVKKFGVTAIYEGEEGQAYCYNKIIPSDFVEEVKETETKKKRHREEEEVVGDASTIDCAQQPNTNKKTRIDMGDDSNAQKDSIDEDLSDEEDDIIVDDDINDKDYEEHDDDDSPLFLRFLRILLLCSCFKKKEKE